MKYRFELQYDFVKRNKLVERFEELKSVLNRSACQIRLTAYSEFDNCPDAKSIRFTLTNYNDNISAVENAYKKLEWVCYVLKIEDRPRLNLNFKG